MLSEWEATTSCKGLVVTLVHGTWGSNSSFLHTDSPLRKYLRGSIAEPVEFLVFPWSGFNTHAARIQAGLELAHFLRGAFKAYPEHSHAIVCHSHGGNVVVYALRHLGYASSQDLTTMELGGVRVDHDAITRLRQRIVEFEHNSLIPSTVLGSPGVEDGLDQRARDLVEVSRDPQEKSLLRLYFGHARFDPELLAQQELLFRFVHESQLFFRDLWHGEAPDAHPCRLCCVSVGAPFLSCPTEAIDETRRVSKLLDGLVEKLKTPMKEPFYLLVAMAGPAIFVTLLALTWQRPLLLFAAAFVISFLIPALLEGLAKFAHHAAAHAVETGAHSVNVSFLCLRMKDDEAIWWLRMVTRAVRIFNLMERPMEKMLIVVGSALAVLGEFVGLIGAIGWYLWKSLPQLVFIGALALVLGSCLLSLALLLRVGLGAVVSLLTSHGGGLGLDGVKSGFFLRYIVRSKPGGVGVEEKRFTENDCGELPKSGFAWQHSILFSCEASLDWLTGFICRNCNVKRKVPASDIYENIANNQGAASSVTAKIRSQAGWILALLVCLGMVIAIALALRTKDQTVTQTAGAPVNPDLLVFRVHDSWDNPMWINYSLKRLREIPGLIDAAAIVDEPRGVAIRQATVRSSNASADAELAVVSTDYFSTLQRGFLSGGPFKERNKSPQVIVDGMLGALGGPESLVGKRLMIHLVDQPQGAIDYAVEVVGAVERGKFRGRSGEVGRVYLALDDTVRNPVGNIAFITRWSSSVSSEQDLLMRAVSRQLGAVIPRASVTRLEAKALFVLP